jgi:hypothetical protein
MGRLFEILWFTLMTLAIADLLGRWFWLLQMVRHQPKPALRTPATELQITRSPLVMRVFPSKPGAPKPKTGRGVSSPLPQPHATGSEQPAQLIGPVLISTCN